MNKAEHQNTNLAIPNTSNITKPIEIVNKAYERIAFWTREEMNEKLASMQPGAYGMLLQFLWRTGVRVSEATGLTMGDLDFKEEQIRIRWLKNRKYQTRIIPMHSSLKFPLYTFCAKLNKDEKVFPYSRQYVFFLCKKHGFGHPHKIRHSFAVNFLKQTKSPNGLIILQKLLGHSNIQTTMIYLQVVPFEQKEAIELIKFDG